MLTDGRRRTVHDVSHKLYDNQLDHLKRNDTSYRNWIKGKLKRINSERNSIVIGDQFNEKIFAKKYFARVNPQLDRSFRELGGEMTNKKVLMGPGYYNPLHKNTDQSCPSFSFEAVSTLNLNKDTLDSYSKE